MMACSHPRTSEITTDRLYTSQQPPRQLNEKAPPDWAGLFVLCRFFDYFAAGGCSPEVSTVVLSVFVVEPSGVVTVVVFLTSAFLSQPTKAAARPSTMQSAMNRFMIQAPMFGEISRCQNSWLVLLAIKKIHRWAGLFPILSKKTQIDRGHGWKQYLRNSQLNVRPQIEIAHWLGGIASSIGGRAIERSNVASRIISCVPKSAHGLCGVRPTVAFM